MPCRVFRACALILLLAGMVMRAGAAEVSVKATLSHRSAEVGEPVQLQISIDGTSKSSNPPDVNVDGLEIRYFGPSSSQQIQMINGQITRQITTTHVYQVTANRTGEFTIPALAVEVDGRTYNTAPVALKVEKASGGGGKCRVQGRGDRHAALVHATPHESDSRRLRDRSDPQRRAHAAALHEFDVEDSAGGVARRGCQGQRVLLVVQALVGRDAGAPAWRESPDFLEGLAGDGLLDKLDRERRRPLEETGGLFDRVADVGVHADRRVRADEIGRAHV